MNHIVKLNQTALPDSTVAREMKLKMSKVACVITNVISKAIEQKHVATLREKCYSILVNESYDIANNKNLCIHTKSISDDGVTYLLDYVKIKDASAGNLFQVFKHCLSKYNLSMDNIVRYCNNNANVMVGEHNSFLSRLLKENKDIVVFGCICHSLTLVASAATEVLPKNIESMLHLIYSYFSRSPKRQSILEKLQSFMRTCQVKMINPSKTRWLALGNCVARVLNQWSVLFSLFAEAKLEDKTSVAGTVFADLSYPFTKAYLQFLNFVLLMFNSFNILFQSERVVIVSLASEAERFLRLLASYFLKPSLLLEDVLSKYNVKHPSNLLPLDEIKIRVATEETLNKMNSGMLNRTRDIKLFRRRCLQFYQVAFEETLKRLPLQQGLMRALAFLDPSNALGVSTSICRSSIHLTPVIQKFKSNVDSEKVQNEWSIMTDYFSGEEKTVFLRLSILEFWRKIEQCEKFNSEFQFQNIGKLARICLSLPHSNASVESIFSMVSDIKTRKRNKLLTRTVTALVCIKLDMRNMKKVCYDYPVTDDMLDLLNENMNEKEHQVTEISTLLAAEEEEDEDGEDMEIL